MTSSRNHNKNLLIGSTFGRLSLILDAGIRSSQNDLLNIDIVGRYGGDEFLVILIETSEPEALRIAERIQQKAKEVTIPPHKPLLGLSIGVASQNSDYGGILKEADDRLYAQKRLNPPHS